MNKFRQPAPHVAVAVPEQLVTDHTKSAMIGKTYDLTKLPDEGIALPHPAIEKLPEYLATIPSDELVPGCRHFNASVCRDAQGRLLLAYRLELVNARNVIAIARLSDDLDVLHTFTVNFPDEGIKAVQWEDPRLSVVAGELLLICAWVKFGTPSICRQRLWRIDPDSLQPMTEIIMPYGRAAEGHPEKNWMPFEAEDGGLALVYQQREHCVIEHPSADGYTTPGLVGWKSPGRYLSGRTPPVRLPDGKHWLAFFGGHVKHEYRGARYFVGALVFTASRPYGVVLATPQPLCWGTEASPTLLSARPASGHPCCLYPAGVVINGREVLVSCGVNDSYNVFLRYNLPDLLARMQPVNDRGEFA